MAKPQGGILANRINLSLIRKMDIIDSACSGASREQIDQSSVNINRTLYMNLLKAMTRKGPLGSPPEMIYTKN
jgi:hypothetical protein